MRCVYVPWIVFLRIPDDKPAYHRGIVVLGNIVPEKEVGLIKDRMRRLLDWVLDQPDLEVSTFGNMFRQYAGSRRDLVGLLDECGLAPGQAGELPLGNSGADPDFLQGLFRIENIRGRLIPEVLLETICAVRLPDYPGRMLPLSARLHRNRRMVAYDLRSAQKDN